MFSQGLHHTVAIWLNLWPDESVKRQHAGALKGPHDVTIQIQPLRYGSTDMQRAGSAPVPPCKTFVADCCGASNVKCNQMQWVRDDIQAWCIVMMAPPLVRSCPFFNCDSAQFGPSSYAGLSVKITGHHMSAVVRCSESKTSKPGAS